MRMQLLQRIREILFDSVEILVIGGGIFVVIYAFLFQFHEVKGSSMFPTFKESEYIITNVLTKRLHSFKRGDVVVFHSPADDDKLYIKRVIAIPGERVMVSEGKVYLNGIYLDESKYLDSSVTTSPGAFLPERREITVPEKSLFVMGDNRLFSSDSREWGFLENEKIVGRSMIRIWPPSVISIIRNPF